MDISAVNLFLLDVTTGKFTDLTEGNKEDVPPPALGSSNDYNFSPDGNEVAYSLNPEFSKATSTNIEIYLVSLTSPKTPKLISTSKGVDFQPVYSPTGEWIAWASMKHAGYEADSGCGHRGMFPLRPTIFSIYPFALDCFSSSIVPMFIS